MTKTKWMRWLFPCLSVTILTHCKTQTEASVGKDIVSATCESRTLSVLSPLKQLGGHTPQQLTTQAAALQFCIVKVDPTLDTENVAGMLTLFEQIHATTATKPTTPLKVTLLGQDYGGSSYVAQRMTVAHRIEFSDGQITSAADATAGTSHEYGHVLFDAMMAAKNPIYAEHIATKIRYFDLRDEIEALAAHDANDPQVDVLIQRGKAVIASRTPAVQAVYEWMLPYNELFADVVAVLQAKDVRAITKIVESDPALRDFSKVVPSQGWDKEDAYGLFTPMRGVMGQVYKVGEATPSIPAPKLLRALIVAIDADYKNWTSKPGFAWNAVTVPEANERLAKALAAAIAAP